MKKIIKSIFNKIGFEIKKKPKPEADYDYYRNEHMITGLSRSKHRGLVEVNTIIDLGAAQGAWSLSALEFWPDSTYVLFEPLKEREEELNKLCLKHENFHFIAAAAGKEKGAINFIVSDDLDGSGVSDGSATTNIRSVEVTSVDNEVMRLQLNGPYIVKLDTHGFEVPIIEGCSEILNNVSLFIIECYGFHITKDSLLFWEMCQYMDSKGFRLIDIVDNFNRQKDGAFWQCDAFFVPQTLPLFNDNSFL